MQIVITVLTNMRLLVNELCEYQNERCKIIRFNVQKIPYS